MDIDEDMIAIQAANVRLTVQILLALSEAKLLHPERAVACATDLKLIAATIDKNRLEAHGPDAPPQAQAALFQGIAQLLENRAKEG